jgi:hypothetical protein
MKNIEQQEESLGLLKEMKLYVAQRNVRNVEARHYKSQ